MKIKFEDWKKFYEIFENEDVEIIISQETLLKEFTDRYEDGFNEGFNNAKRSLINKN